MTKAELTADSLHDDLRALPLDAGPSGLVSNFQAVDRRGQLSARDQQQLAVAAVSGDRAARDRLASSFAMLARQLARQRARRDPGVGRDDLEQDAYEALLHALGRYDPDRGVPVAAWVAEQIRFRLADRAAEQRAPGGVPVRVSRHAWRSGPPAIRRAGEHEAADLPGGDDPASHAIRRDQARTLWTAVRRLPHTQQQALVHDLTGKPRSPAQRSARRRALSALADQPAVRQLR